MAKAHKILEKMRVTKAGWKASDFKKLYEAYGFKDAGTGGDTKYVHQEYPELMAAVSKSSGDLPTGYAVTAVKLIDRLTALKNQSNIESQGEDEDREENDDED